MSVNRSSITSNSPQSDATERAPEDVLRSLERKFGVISSELHRLKLIYDNNRRVLKPVKNAFLEKSLLLSSMENSAFLEISEPYNNSKLALSRMEEELNKGLDDFNMILKMNKFSLERTKLETARLQRYSEKIQSSSITREDLQGKRAEQYTDAVKQDLEKELRKHNKALVVVLDKTFPGDKMKEILKDLISSYAEDAGSYIDIDESDYEYYKTLLEAKIIKKHPNDPMKVKIWVQ